MLGLMLAGLGLIVSLARIEVNLMQARRAEIAAYSIDQVLLDRWCPVKTTWEVLTDRISSGQALVYYLRQIMPLTVGIPVLWTWLTAASLMVFKFSMRRARVRPVHTLRCVLYSFDLIPWVGVLLIGAFFMSWTRDDDHDAVVCWLSVLVGLAAVQASYRLGHALKWYLRFDRPAASVVASQIIVLLALLVLLSLFDCFDLFYDLVHASLRMC